MGYYMGDYYSMSGSTSFYRGDPFWGFLGRLAKGVVGSLTGLSASAAPKALPAVAGRAETIGRMGGAAVSRIGGMVARHPVLSAAGAAAVLGAGAGAGVERMVGMGGACPKGHHISKSKHSLGRCVKNRRMRVTNPKALRRAIRRAHGFARMARKCISFTSARPPKGRMYFKHRKRK
jgi:hypothetical protein